MRNNNPRITLEDDAYSAIVKMVEGNPGATVVLAQFMQDPDGFIYMCHLDDLKIYGHLIWMAYKDFSESNLDKLKRAVVNRDKEFLDFIANAKGERNEV